MTKIQQNLSRFRRIAMGALLLAGSLSNAACGPRINTPICPGGRTAVDGVCADTEVADYVACVRAQAAQVNASSTQGVSVDAGYGGVNVGTGFQNGETLEKRYDAGDAAAMAVIEACNRKLGIDAPPAEAKPALAGYWAGIAFERGHRYSMHVKVASQGPGRCAAIAYPELGCVSVLHCATPAADGSIRAVEQVVRGRRCVNGGKVTLSPQANGTLSFLWKGTPQQGVATGSLHPDRTP